MKLRLALTLVLMAVLTRLGLHLLPHPPYNFSPIAAIGLFGAACFDRRWLALAVPFLALFISDLVLNNVIYRAFFPEFAFFTSWWIYLAFGLAMALGWLFLRAKQSPARLIGTSLAASLLFFLITNFSVWFEGTMYPKTAEGLLACYAAGIPFLGNTILGDLFFTGALFGSFHFVLNRQAQKQHA